MKNSHGNLHHIDHFLFSRCSQALQSVIAVAGEKHGHALWHVRDIRNVSNQKASSFGAFKIPVNPVMRPELVTGLGTRPLFRNS